METEQIVEKEVEIAPEPIVEAPKDEVVAHIEEKLAEKEAKTPEIETPEYVPNTKYNVKGKEFDLPDWAKASLKSADNEKEIKEIFEKAAGIDHIKQKHQELYTQNQKVNDDFKNLANGVQELRDTYQEATKTGNLLMLDGFFQKLNIPFPVLLNYLQQKVQFQELPEEQQRMFYGSIEAQKRTRELESQNQMLTESQSAAQSQARAMQLQSIVSRQDVAPVVNHFDSLPGRKPGDFWNLVKEHGEYTWYKSGGQVDLSPEEAVQQVIQKLSMSAPQAQQMQQQQSSQRVVEAHKGASLPNVNSKSSASPMKKKVKTEEDINKYYKEKYASQ